MTQLKIFCNKQPYANVPLIGGKIRINQIPTRLPWDAWQLMQQNPRAGQHGPWTWKLEIT